MQVDAWMGSLLALLKFYFFIQPLALVLSVIDSVQSPGLRHLP